MMLMLRNGVEAVADPPRAPRPVRNTCPPLAHRRPSAKARTNQKKSELLSPASPPVVPPPLAEPYLTAKGRQTSLLPNTTSTASAPHDVHDQGHLNPPFAFISEKKSRLATMVSLHSHRRTSAASMCRRPLSPCPCLYLGFLPSASPGRIGRGHFERSVANPFLPP
jgi:hypothetical protein